MNAQHMPPCEGCGDPATCFGLHDGDDAYACDTCCEARSEHFAPDDPPMCEPLCLLCAKLASNCECTGGPMTDPTYREPVER